MQTIPSNKIELPKLLTDIEVRSYVDSGYFIAENILWPQELEELKAEISLLAKKELLGQSSEVANREDITLNSILAIHKPHYVSRLMQHYVMHPTVCAMLSQLSGAHLAYWSGNVKNTYSIVFIKPPGFQGQAWHQDESYVPTRDRSQIAAWVAIDDATIENGCLWVVPGSHQAGYLYPTKDHNNYDEFDDQDEAFGFDESTASPLEITAGSVIFLNGYLLHRSRKNRSSSSRRCLVSHYMSAESLLPWMTAETKDFVARADNRKVLLVAGVDPYAWKGYQSLDDPPYVRYCKASRTKNK